MSLKEVSIQEGKKHGWGLLLIRRDEFKALLDRLFQEKQHLDILEIGCYKGYLVGWLHENYPKTQYSWNYWGVDIIEPPDRRQDYPHYIMNAEILEFPANRFDLVVMIEVLEHVVDYVRALREIHRVLKPGGYVFIQSVICSAPTALADQTHFHVLHPVTLSRILAWLGFTNIEYVEGGTFAIWARKG